MLSITWDDLQQRLEEKDHGWTCLWGNLLRYCRHAGLTDDTRLRAVIQTVVNDGITADWRCQYNDERPCAWGAARALWGLAALPERLHTLEVEQAVQSGLSFLLDEYSLVDADYPVPEGGKIHSIWSRLNFPLFYQADILFVLRTLRELGRLSHPGASPALQWLSDRQTKDGRWRGSSPFRSRTWKAMGGPEETHRWVSLHAAHILDTSELQTSAPKESEILTGTA